MMSCTDVRFFIRAGCKEIPLLYWPACRQNQFSTVHKLKVKILHGWSNSGSIMSQALEISIMHYLIGKAYLTLINSKNVCIKWRYQDCSFYKNVQRLNIYIINSEDASL